MKEYARRLRERVGANWLLQLPSVTVAIWDERERLLLVRHSLQESWLLPGGTIEPGERPAEAAFREALEETGLQVRLTGLVGVFGGPEFIVEYKGEERTSYVMSVFEAEMVGGELSTASDEISEARFLAPSEAQALPLARWVPPVLRALSAGEVGGAHFQPARRAPPE